MDLVNFEVILLLQDHTIYIVLLSLSMIILMSIEEFTVKEIVCPTVHHQREVCLFPQIVAIDEGRMILTFVQKSFILYLLILTQGAIMVQSLVLLIRQKG